MSNIILFKHFLKPNWTKKIPDQPHWQKILFLLALKKPSRHENLWYKKEICGNFVHAKYLQKYVIAKQFLFHYRSRSTIQPMRTWTRKRKINRHREAASPDQVVSVFINRHREAASPDQVVSVLINRHREAASPDHVVSVLINDYCELNLCSLKVCFKY